MGMQASIDIDFAHKYSPKDIILRLLHSGWTTHFEGQVSYLLPADKEQFDWVLTASDNFDLPRFLASHSTDDRIGITLVNGENIGGNFLIYPERLSLSLSINRVYIPELERVVDFNYYLHCLSSLLQGMNVSAITCESLY